LSPPTLLDCRIRRRVDCDFVSTCLNYAFILAVAVAKAEAEVST
jgi:hypothetical protein